MLKLNHKVLAAVTVGIFLLGLIPVLYLSGYVHASGDDYNYGAYAHSVWLATHSIWETLKAAWQNAVDCWYSWQGTWFTLFLFALQPEVFSPDAYWIVPWMMLAVNIAATSVVVYYVLVKKLKFRKSTFLTVNFALLFAMIQFFPKTKSGIFWYNGTIHYIVPYALAMLAIWCFWAFIDTKKKRYLMGACFCMAALGGCSYLAVLLAPIVLVYLLLVYGRKEKHAFALLLPLFLEMAGLLVSVLAPGNKARGGEEFGFSISAALQTIGMSFVSGVTTAAEYVREKPAVFVILIFIGLVIWEAYMQMEKIPSFPRPLLFVAAMYCLYCAMFAPGIYAAVDLSGGVPNTIFQVFLLTAAADIVYVLGWTAHRLSLKGKKNDSLAVKKFRLRVALPLLAVSALWLFVQKGTLKQTTFYSCIYYVVSGQADDYEEQMEERLEILLDDTKKDIELPAMNPEQGPLMHMEIMPEEDAWTNQVMKNFYKKDRIVRVDRVQK